MKYAAGLFNTDWNTLKRLTRRMEGIFHTKFLINSQHVAQGKALNNQAKYAYINKQENALTSVEPKL